MKWLQDNPLGMTLAGIGGVFALLALAMSIVWTLPETAEVTAADQPETGSVDAVLVAHQVADLAEFEVINEKPVFNETRRPSLEEIADNGEMEDDAVAVKDAPDVRLTGIIITPDMRIASLTPADAELESIMAHEGQALTGEYVGWQLSAVHPRSVVLESRNGEKLELDLQVHDVKIKEPPKPAAETKAEPSQAEVPVDEDGQPLSRADQIRQRIAERREELRREQEEQQSQSAAQAKTDRSQSYQNAIRAMLRNKNKDNSGDDENDS